MTPTPTPPQRRRDRRRRPFISRRVRRWCVAVAIPLVLASICPIITQPHCRAVCNAALVAFGGRPVDLSHSHDAGVP